MKSWDLQAYDRASTITHVDREKKIVPNTATKYFTFLLGKLLRSDIFWYISKYLETTWHFIQDSYIY